MSRWTSVQFACAAHGFQCMSNVLYVASPEFPVNSENEKKSTRGAMRLRAKRQGCCFDSKCTKAEAANATFGEFQLGVFRCEFERESKLCDGNSARGGWPREGVGRLGHECSSRASKKVCVFQKWRSAEFRILTRIGIVGLPDASCKLLARSQRCAAACSPLFPSNHADTHPLRLE